MAVYAGTNAVFQVWIGGNDANGGGYDSSIAGAGTDYSQQTAAQATFTNLTCPVSSGAATITDASGGNLFTTAMIGNAIKIASGTNFAAGVYFIIGRTNANTVTLDRSASSSASTTGTAGHASVGGAWGNPNQNSSNISGVACTVMVQGSGSDNPTTPDYTTNFSLNGGGGASGVGMQVYLGFNGRPYCTASSAVWLNLTYATFENFKLGLSANTANSLINSGVNSHVRNVRFDQLGFTGQLLSLAQGCSADLIECTNSGASVVNGKSIINAAGSCSITNAFLHDFQGLAGINYASNSHLFVGFTVIANNTQGDGILSARTISTSALTIEHCTIDGNAGNGINSSDVYIASLLIRDTVITNHTGAGVGGIGNTSTLTSAQATALSGSIRRNGFYNNTSHYVGMSAPAPATDTIFTGNPYNNRATEDYTISLATGQNVALPLLQSNGAMTAVTTYTDLGAIQRIVGSGGGGGNTYYTIERTINLIMEGEEPDDATFV